MIHRSRKLGLDQDLRLIAGPYWPNEDPLPSIVVCYMLTRLHRWYEGIERAQRESSKYQHIRGTADGAVEASDVVTQKQCWPSEGTERTKWMGPDAMTSMSEASARRASPSTQSHSGSGRQVSNAAVIRASISQLGGFSRAGPVSDSSGARVPQLITVHACRSHRRVPSAQSRCIRNRPYQRQIEQHAERGCRPWRDRSGWGAGDGK
jgi:hypothetical protein